MNASKFFPIIGLVLFAYIIIVSDPWKIVTAFSNLNFPFLLLSLMMSVFILFLKALKWKFIINLHGFDHPLTKCVKAWTVGMFAGLITPARAGDLIRSFYIQRKNIRFGHCLSTVVVDRILDLSVIMLFSLWGIFFISEMAGYPAQIMLMVPFVIIFIVLIYLVTRRKFTRIIMKPIVRLLVSKIKIKKLKKTYHEMYDSFDDIGKKKGHIVIMLIFSSLIWMISILQIRIIGLAIGIEIDYLFLLAVMSLVVIIELIPISIFGMGTREAFLIFAFGIIGILKESVIAFSISYLILAYWSVGLLGLIFWLREPVKIKM